LEHYIFRPVGEEHENVARTNLEKVWTVFVHEGTNELKFQNFYRKPHGLWKVKGYIITEEACPSEPGTQEVLITPESLKALEEQLK
jgi:hypothetical protein